LVFELSSQPTNWATHDADIPVTKISEHLILTPPFIADGLTAFKNSTAIEVGHLDSEAELFYQWNNGEVTSYSAPVEISESGMLTVFAKKGQKESIKLKTEFFKIDPNISVELESDYANEYSAGGQDALIDGIRGTTDFRTGSWQGYQNQDVIATVDLGKTRSVDTIESAFLQNQRSWIFYPTSVLIEVSVDGETWETMKRIELSSAEPSEEIAIKKIQAKLNGKDVRLVRLTASTLGVLPEWHLGYPHQGTACVFIDEIIIE